MSYPDQLHPTHNTRISDASSFDEICINCGFTDDPGHGWGKLALPCPKVKVEEIVQGMDTKTYVADAELEKPKHPTFYALDYDGTASEFPRMYDTIIDLWRDNGIIPFIVTMRFKNEALDMDIHKDIPVIYTGRMSKIEYIHRQFNFHFNVWIDDCPHFLFQDAYTENKKAPKQNHWLLPVYEDKRTTGAEFDILLKRQLGLFSERFKYPAILAT